MDKNILNQLKTGICFLEVEIRNPVDIQNSGSFIGSGFVITHPESQKKLIVTCAHVAPNSTRTINIEFSNGFRTKGKVVYTDHAHDFSFIEYEDDKNLQSGVPYEFEKVVSQFDTLTLIGGNEGYKSYVASGIVADPHILIDERNTVGIQSSIPTAGGTSGSAVFNEDGKIVGMHIAGTERCSFELAIEIILDALDRFIHEIPKLESGITFEYENKYKFISAGLITDEDETNYFSHSSKLLVIKDVDVLYEAFNLLMPGDVVLSINQEPVLNAFYAERFMNDSRNRNCDFTVKRNGKVIEVKFKLKVATQEKTNRILLWENCTFQDSNILTRRYYSIKEEGVLLSKCVSGSPFFMVGGESKKVNGGKGTLITHFNGIRVKNLDQFLKVLSENRPAAVSFHYYDYITVVPMKFIICDVSYDQVSEVVFLEKEIFEQAA